MTITKNIKSNIWKLYCDRFISNSWLFAPILVPYYVANGLNATQVFAIQAIFSVALCIFEIPTGYFSDVLGRRKTLIIGSALFPTGVVVYAFSHSFWGFVIAEILLATAMSMRSGTDSALLYDTLIELNREKEHKKIEGTCHFFSSMGSASAAIIGGFLSAISLRLVFYVNIATSMLLLPLALAMKEPKREARENKKAKAHLSELVNAIKYCARHPEIRNAAIYTSIISGTGMVGYWSYYLYFGKLDINVVYYGALAAIFGFTSGAGGKLAHVFEKRFGTTAALCLPLLAAPIYILLGQIQSIYALPLIYLNTFLWGFSVPILRDIVHTHTKTAIRATVLSAISMGGRLVYVAIAVIYGKIIDTYSLQNALTFLGITFLIVGSYAAYSLVKRRNDM